MEEKKNGQAPTMMEGVQGAATTAPAEQDTQATEEDALQPLINLASALLDIDRLRIAARLVEGAANRMELEEATGIAHRDLLRHLNLLQYFGLAKREDGGNRNADHFTRYVLDEEAFRQARQAMGKIRGRKPRPTDFRALTLETFMPGGKLTAFPRKQEQLAIILEEAAARFQTERQYKEREVNVILEEMGEDYCTLRRHLIDFGYLSRSKGIYTKNV